MRKAWRYWLIIALLLLFTAPQLTLASPGFEIHPSIDVADFIIYTVKQGNISSTTVFPSSFKITWNGEYDYVVNGFWCPAFWDPSCDPATYKYDIESPTYSFGMEPPQIVETGGMRILLTYFVTVSINAYATKNFIGWLEEHIKIIVTVYAYGRVDTPPDEPTIVDLGSLLGSGSIPVDYEATVVRKSPDTKTYRASGTVDLLLDNLEVAFYKLYARWIFPNAYGNIAVGKFNEDGYIGVLSKGDISVTLCLDGPRPYTLEGTVSYYNRYGSAESKVTLIAAPGGGCVGVSLTNVALIPGNYSGDNKFVLTFRTGSFITTLATDAEVRGTMAIASRPVVVVYGEDNSWRAKIYIGVDYKAYGYYMPAYVRASGTISIDSVSGAFTCPSQPFYASGQYECTVNLQLSGSPQGVQSCRASVRVDLTISGTTNSDEVEAICSIITPTSTHGIIASLYDVLSKSSLLLILAMVFLYVVNYISVFFGKPFIDQYHIMQGLLVAVTLTATIQLAPYFYWLVLNGIYAIPELSSVLSTTPITSPSQVLGLSREPSQVVAIMMSYYDITLNELKIDYKNWFENEMYMHIFVRIAVAGGLVATLAIGGLALLLTGHSFVVGSVLTPLVGYLFSIISLMLMILPLTGVVNALIAFSEVVIVIAAIVALTVFLLGLVMAVIPSPLSQRLSEDFLGAGILYLLGIPVFGPVIYAIYGYIKQNISLYIQRVYEAISLPSISFLNISLDIVFPLTPILRMLCYVTLAAMVSLMITLTHVYILSRTGVMSGLGEAIMRVARR